MRIAPRDASGPIASAIREHRGSVSLTQLAKNVEKDGARVLIPGVPMVDQGPKGYCVVAASQRLFEYYGISCDQHQIAKIAGTDAKAGTNSKKMMEALIRPFGEVWPMPGVAGKPILRMTAAGKIR